MHLCQIAFSVPDIEPTYSFYQNCFKLRPSGEMPILRGPIVAGLVGLPKVNYNLRFLTDDQDFLHLEFNRFKNPKPRPSPQDWRPCDIGISRLAIKVRDFRNTLFRLGSAGSQPLTQEIQVDGTRRVCVHDPEGVLIEVIEARADELPEATPSRIAGVALSVPNLEAARRSYVEALGFREIQTPLPYREVLWNLDGSERDIMLLDAEGCWIEIAQYRDPQPTPRPQDYRKSDKGLVHLALGFRSRGDYDRALQRAIDGGFRRSKRVMHYYVMKTAYLADPLGFTLEMMYFPRWMDRIAGFKSPPLPMRLMNTAVRKLAG